MQTKQNKKNPQRLLELPHSLQAGLNFLNLYFSILSETEGEQKVRKGKKYTSKISDTVESIGTVSQKALSQEGRINLL